MKMLDLPFEGPLWLGISVTTIVTIIRYGPGSIQSWQNIGTRNQKREWEKKRLEMLKLRYEIEAIKKNNQLPTLEEEAQFLKAQKIAEQVDTASITDEPISLKLPYFGLTVVGSVIGFVASVLLVMFLPSLRRLIETTSSNTPDPWPTLASNFILLVVVYAFNASVLLSFLPRKFQKRWGAFVISFLLPLVAILLSGIFKGL